jgi:hypothetical protein
MRTCVDSPPCSRSLNCGSLSRWKGLLPTIRSAIPPSPLAVARHRSESPGGTMALVAIMLPRTGPVRHENSRSNRRPKCHLNLDHHVSLLAGSTQRSQTIEGPVARCSAKFPQLFIVENVGHSPLRIFGTVRSRCWPTSHAASNFRRWRACPDAANVSLCLRSVRSWQHVGMVAQVVIRRCCGRGRAGTWRVRACKAGDRTGCREAAVGSCRCVVGHACEERVAPRRAALLGVLGHHLSAFIGDPVHVGRFGKPQPLRVGAHL